MASKFYQAFERMMEAMGDAHEEALKAFPDEKEEIDGSFEAVTDATDHLDDILHNLDKQGYINPGFREYSDEPDEDE